MKVWCDSWYLSGAYSGAEQSWYETNKYVKALKGRDLNGYAIIRRRFLLRDWEWRIDETSRDDAFHIFAMWAATMVRAIRVLERPDVASVALVPIPTKQAVVGEADLGRYTAMKMAVAAAERIGVENIGHSFRPIPCFVADVLRWDTRLTPASEQGPRWRGRLYEHLQLLELPVLERLKFDSTLVVLIDDVCTTKGHLEACGKVLFDIGADPYTALIAARTTNATTDEEGVPIDPWRVPSFEAEVDWQHIRFW